MPADRPGHAPRIVGVGLPCRFGPDADAADVVYLVVFQQYPVELCRHFVTYDAKYDAAVVEVVVYAGHVVDQAVADDEVAVRATVLGCHVDAVTHRANV